MVSNDDVTRLRHDLEALAIACLEVLAAKADILTDAEAQKLRNAARAAVTRSMELPRLVEEDRAAWLRRTMQFADAVSRLLIQHLNVQLE